MVGLPFRIVFMISIESCFYLLIRAQMEAKVSNPHFYLQSISNLCVKYAIRSGPLSICRPGPGLFNTSARKNLAQVQPMSLKTETKSSQYSRVG